MKKGLGLLLMMMVLVIGAVAGCSGNKQEASKEKKLVMATSADYAPFEYIETGKSDEIVGFDIELAKTISKRLGYTLDIENMDFKGVIPAVSQKQVDFAMSGINPDKDRKKVVDFSDSYYVSKHAVVYRNDKPVKSVDELKGKTVGVQLGSTQEKEVEKLDGVNVEKRNKIPDLIQELKAGRIDVAVIEDAVAKGYLQKDKNLNSFLLPNTKEVSYVIAFQKGSDLKEPFNKELKKMKESGELDQLIQKWFAKQQ